MKTETYDLESFNSIAGDNLDQFDFEGSLGVTGEKGEPNDSTRTIPKL